jgi:hypothetical protein
MSLELFRCDRLSASISRKQCEINRKGKPQSPRSPEIKVCFACEGCPGLGSEITVDPEEIMASRCKIDNCTKLAQHGKNGMCCTHFAASKPLAAGKEQPATKPAKHKQTCTVAGCTKAAQHGKDGMCKRHHTAAMLEAGMDPVGRVIEHIELAAAVQVKEVLDTYGVALSTHKSNVGDGKGGSIIVDPVIANALADAWIVKRNEWLLELTSLKPGKAIVTTAKMIEALEGLGY